MDNFLIKKRNIRVAISSSCNFNCVYCDGTKGRSLCKPGAMEDFRKKPLEKGFITTDEIIEIIKSLSLAGFDGMSLTGGEPFLNPDLNKIIRKSKEVGISRVGVTTNGSLLDEYIKKNGNFSDDLSLLTLSLDTIESDRFKQITGYDKLNQIIESVKKIKKNNPKLKIRANKVVMQSDMKSLIDYLDFCEKTGAIDEVKLLNLLLKEDDSKIFFEKEFISTPDILSFFSNHSKYKFLIDEKYEYVAKLSNGFKIILMDTNLTLRSQQCENCSIYCQEGFFTVRVGTDGNITTCPDYQSKLPSIDGIAALKKGILSKEINSLVKNFESLRLEKTLNKFFQKKKVKLNY